MKKTSFFTFLLLTCSLFIFNSCDKESIEDFDLSFTNVAVTVGPLVAPNGNEYLLTDTLTNEIEAQLQQLGASAEDIESIKLSDLKLRITGPAGRNFDNIEFVEARILTGTGPEDFTKIAFSDGVLDGKSEVTLVSQDVNLKELLASGNDFRLGFWGYHTVPFVDNTNFSFDLVVKVKAKVTE